MFFPGAGKILAGAGKECPLVAGNQGDDKLAEVESATVSLRQMGRVP